MIFVVITAKLTSVFIFYFFLLFIVCVDKSVNLDSVIVIFLSFIVYCSFFWCFMFLNKSISSFNCFCVGVF
nr:hypothetical protein [Mucilaginibacter sp. FT3.2]